MAVARASRSFLKTTRCASIASAAPAPALMSAWSTASSVYFLTFFSYATPPALACARALSDATFAAATSSGVRAAAVCFAASARLPSISAASLSARTFVKNSLPLPSAFDTYGAATSPAAPSAPITAAAFSGFASRPSIWASVSSLPAPYKPIDAAPLPRREAKLAPFDAAPTASAPSATAPAASTPLATAPAPLAALPSTPRTPPCAAMPMPSPTNLATG